jgi:hypothetical protein
MDMRYLKIFATCLVALALRSPAWAEIYETTDAKGNPDFTDSPADADAEVVNLPETNVANAPQPEQQDASQPGTVTTEQAPEQVNNNTVIVNDGNDNDDYDDGVDDDDLARQRALDRVNPAVPREVGDTEAQMPHEVGDTEAQMPHEVGDTESQMPHEVGDFPDATGAHRR